MAEDFSELDRIIQQYITVRTPREIADMVGTTPERVIKRAQELKDEIDALTLEEQITFLMFRLNRIAADAENDAKLAGYEFKGGLYSAATSAIKESLRQIGTLKKENDDRVEALNQKRLQELLRLFDVIVARGVAQISKTYGLDEKALTEVFQENILAAAKEVESR